MRIKFKKGKQRFFLKKVLEKTNCPSLKELIQRGFDIPYSTLKNYFNESRTLPEDLFDSLCIFANIKKDEINFKILREDFGQIKGGLFSRKNGPIKNRT